MPRPTRPAGLYLTQGIPRVPTVSPECLMSRLLELQLPWKRSAAFLLKRTQAQEPAAMPACPLPPPSQEGIKFSFKPFQPKLKSSRAGGIGGYGVEEMNVLDHSVVSGARFNCFVSERTSYTSPNSQPFLEDVGPFYHSEPSQVSRVYRLHFSICWTPSHPSKP